MVTAALSFSHRLSLLPPLLCSVLALSDYIIKEKTVLLQKKDNEGFGFVLRGAKGEPQSPHSFVRLCRHFFVFFFFLTCRSPPTSLTHVSSAAQTPIEEFTPTPAFPALQYLESVDEGGVAWRAGLRMGDFLIEVKIFHPKSQSGDTSSKHHYDRCTWHTHQVEADKVCVLFSITALNSV